MRQRIVVGVSGASGAPIAIEVLRFLRECGQVETHLVLSDSAERTLALESSLEAREIRALADVIHDNRDIGASIASGTFKSAGMAVVPCSMKTLAGIAHGYSDTLLLRAADVCLKERRRLVLVARECPLSAIHLRNMLLLSEMGAVILPPVLSYYTRPNSVADLTRHIAGKVLDMFDLAPPSFRRWDPGALDI